MQDQLRSLGLMVLLFAVLAVGIASGILIDRNLLYGVAPPATVPEDAREEFALMAEAWNVIRQSYVKRDDITDTEMAYGAISGMAIALGDPGHTRFLTPEMAARQERLQQGAYEGIGAHIEIRDGHPVIVAPFEGSPAQRAGLQTGDIILTINGESVSGLSSSDIVSRVAGPAGSTVSMTLLRPATNVTFEVTLMRERIVLENLSWTVLPGTRLAHLRLASFSQGLTRNLRRALNEIRREDIQGIVLDLRNNPGGLLDEAIGVTSQFLSEGYVLQERDASGAITQVPVRPGGLATTIPLVVLVDQGSASAAEVTAGALQDYERAPIVGVTTFGTGTVLSEFRLSDNSVLLLAVQEWLTPEGRTIWHTGLAPDVVVPLDPNQSPIFPDQVESMTAADLQASGDAQLLAAIELLQAQHPPTAGQMQP